MPEIRHVTESDHKGAFIIDRDGERIAEMTYSRAGEARIIVDHTWVSDELRGQGIARKLLDQLVGWVRAEHATIVPLCPYVKSQFDKDASLGDLLAA